MKKLLVLATFFACFLPSISMAQVMCVYMETSFEEWKKQWKKKYGEDLVSTATTEDGTVILSFADSEDGSFTILGLRPNGAMCGIVAGFGWKNEKVVPGGQEL